MNAKYFEYPLTTSGTPSTDAAITCAVTKGFRAFIFASPSNTAPITVGTTTAAALFSIGLGAYLELPNFPAMGLSEPSFVDVSQWYTMSTAATQTFTVLILAIAESTPTPFV